WIAVHDVILCWRGGILKRPREAASFDIGRRRESGEVWGGGVKGHAFYKSGGAAFGGGGAPPATREGGGAVVIGVFAPHAVIAEMPAMVAPDDDDGVLRQFQFIQGIQQLSELRIHITHRGVIAVNERARFFIVQRSDLGNVGILSQFAPRRRRER